MSVLNLIQIILVIVNGFLIIPSAVSDPLRFDASAVTPSDQYLKKISNEAAVFPWNKPSSTQYLLFTPDYPEIPCKLESNLDALKRCPFNPSYPMKVLIHGFNVTLPPRNPFFKIKDKMLELYKYNVIVLDWTKYNQPSYTIAAVNTVQIGDELGTLMQFLEKNKGVDAGNIHLIGHGLGAHIAGGAFIPNLKRITGLDPAAAIFYPNSYLHRLTKSDAAFVDIIHTSNRTSGYGVKDPVGHIDFYPNGGDTQPMCEMLEEDPQSQRDCNHNAAVFYFLHSIDTNECSFLATKCDSYIDFQEGLCSKDSSPKEQMGLPAVPVPGLPPKTKFYLRTTSSPPYCLQDNEAEPKSLDASAKTLADQNLKKSFKDISYEAARPPRNKTSPIQFLLFTPDHPETPCYLEPNMEALKRCPFNPIYPMKVVIHGFMVTLPPENPVFKIKDKMLELFKYNVIVLDWTKYNQPSYTVAAINTIKTGNDLATLIRFLVKNKGVDLGNIHLIGHGLGAHTSGVTGSQIPNLKRITGLDPPESIFHPYSYLHRLSQPDADFVDIIHTSNTTSGYGINDPIGDIDFYPNGGVTQPMCEEELESQRNVTDHLKSKECNHNAAIFYFLHSIDTNECSFLATKCDSYIDFQKGLCSKDSSPKEQMGLSAVPVPGLPPKTKFYLKTTASPPYCFQDKADQQ